MLDLRVMLAALAVALVSADASADLPPPAGETLVDYTFQIDAAPAGKTVVGFPVYNHDKPDTHVVLVQPAADVRMFQGWTPGLYLLADADANGLTGDDEAVKSYLAAKAKPCLTQVPRIRSVPTTTGIQRMTDVIHVTATATGCEATLVRTLYEGPGGKGEGAVDSSGKRTPPPPFGAEVPDVRAAGFVLTAAPAPTSTPLATPSPTPPPAPASKPASAGCSLRVGRDDGALASLLLVGLTAGRRRPRR